MNLITIVNILGVIMVILCISDIAITYLKGELMCRADDSVVLLIVTLCSMVAVNLAYYF